MLACSTSLSALAVALAVDLVAAREGTPTPHVLSLSQLPSEAALAELLWTRNPDVLAARARVLPNQAEVERAERLPNPILDAAWNTIPVGPTNPEHLAHPLKDVPSYQIGLSQPFELGKRSPRQRAARLGLRAAALEATEVLRLVHLDLLSAIGQVATSEERIASIAEQVADAVRLTQLAHERAVHGDAARLDEERARLEEAKLRSLLDEERQQLSEALRACGRVAGVDCTPFGSLPQAQAFLESNTTTPEAAELRQRLSERPDLQALLAQGAAAQSAFELARARRLPDPTVRVGYTRDQFVVSGNQQNSVSVALALPLPVFERGQADARLAHASKRASETMRALRLEQAERDLARLLDDFARLRVRQDNMRASYLPLARGLVDRLTAAVKAGGTPLPELLLARRSLNELLAASSDLDRTALETSLALRRVTGGSTLPAPESPSSPETP